MKLTDKYITIN